MRITIIYFFCHLSFSHLAEAQSGYRYTSPEQSSDGWYTMNLEKGGEDLSLIYKLLNQLYEQEHKIHSLLVIQNNALVVEEYFGENSQETQHDLRSVTKSVISLLMGIAIDQGFVNNVDDPMLKYIKDKAPKKELDNRKGQITIRHLLTMSSGFDCDDWKKDSKGQEDRIFKKANWIQQTLDLPMINEPGEYSSYCSMGTVLVAEIISQASGMSIDEFATQYLFGPLGISEIDWRHTSKKNVASSARRIYARSRDVAKLGQLILDNGMWDSEQIVSSQWVEQLKTPSSKIGSLEYGFLWWQIPFNVKGKVVNATVATGNGGQYIMIFEPYNLVVVFTGGAYNSDQDKLPFVLMNNAILPTFSDNDQ